MCEDLSERRLSAAQAWSTAHLYHSGSVTLGRSLNLAKPLFSPPSSGRNDSAQIKCNKACKGLGTW